MMGWRLVRSVLAISAGAMLTLTGCGFQGWNSVPLPGAVGRGPDANVYHVEVADVGTLESNSPVMIDDVIVGSVGKMTLRDWHAVIDISVEPDIDVPANAVATVGQTSLLGSMHLALNPPVGEQPTGRLQPGATIPLERSSTFASTEQTLSALSAVVNGGGLGQIGDIIHNFNAALSGREGAIRDLLGQVDTFVGLLDQQRHDIIASVAEMNQFAGTLAGQNEVIEHALQRIPAALAVLLEERPRFTTALDKLRIFSDTATGLVADTKTDLVTNLRNLEPTIRAIADVGSDLGIALAYAPTYPYPQYLIDTALRGDFMNLYTVMDFTIPRLKRTLFLGTRWGDEDVELVPAPGDPYYLNHTYDPLSVGISPPAAPPAAAPDSIPADTLPPEGVPEMPPVHGPLLPVVPPMSERSTAPGQGSSTQIFAGPYPGDRSTPPTPEAGG